IGLASSPPAGAKEAGTDEPRLPEDAEVMLEAAADGPRRAFVSVSPLMAGEVPSGLFLKCFRMAQPCDDMEDLFDNGAVGLRLVAADGTILRANQSELDLL